MKNPLNKRILRLLKEEWGKYLAIFLFMVATIGFVSGFLVADNSMLTSYNQSFEKYNIENGHFELYQQANQQLLNELEKEDVKIYRHYFVEEKTKEVKSTLRIFKQNKKINKVCIMSGELPQNDYQIAIDRMYATNNHLEIGDNLTVKNKKFKISGLVALSDYSALFSNNGDMMFDAVKFGVAITSNKAFDDFGQSHLHYSYAWRYQKQPKNETKEKNLSDDFLKVLNSKTVIKEYTPRYLNQAIKFTGDDMGSDKAMMVVLLYILIVIMAFVFAVTTNNTIVSEASVIGTLRASGYSRKELLKFYICLPLIVTVIACVVGNILGYTLLKDVCAGMYYGSYSLPTFKTLFNSEAFVLTTIIPFILMLVINVIMISYKLQLSPLKFLRHDFKRTQTKKTLPLKRLRFFHRFRLRIIFQNIPSYLTLFVGIFFANVLLMFGMMMTPLLNHYQSEVEDNMISRYQYVLKAPMPTDTQGAEGYYATTLKAMHSQSNDEISVYGVKKNSDYVDIKWKNKGVMISDGYSDKYQLKKGDTITLKQKYGSKKYKFKVAGVYHYQAALSIWMNEKQYQDTFDVYVPNGYFSNHKIKDIDDRFIATTITKDDLTKLSRQLDVSMGQMFYLVDVFAIILFALLIYLLSKIIVEKNKNAISMVKILGYENKEINRLYLTATTWVVVISTLASLYLSRVVIDAIYRAMLADFSGWLTFYMPSTIYIKMFVMTMITYFVVSITQMRRIKKVPMDEALKNVND